MARSAAFIGATLGIALIVGACSSESLGKPRALDTGTGGTTGHPSGTGDGGMATGGQGGASSGSGGNGGGGDIGGSTGNVGDGGSGGGGGAGGGTIPEGAACVADGDCAGMQHFCLRSACDAPTGTCIAIPSEASCAAPACSSADPPCVPPASDGDAVCGCDHVTYANQCDAWAHGVSFSAGFCPTLTSASLPQTCGSLADCGVDASYAKVVACIPSSCESPLGTCVLIGQACVATLPTDGTETCVRGCNGSLYSSVCAARAAGVIVAQPDAGTCSNVVP